MSTTTLTPGQLKAARIRRAAGHRATIPGDRAAAHIRRLRRAGMTDGQIRAAAKISRDTLYRIIAGAPVLRATEARVLAVRPTPAAGPTRSTSAVPPHGTRRRLQGLVVAGWPPVVLAAALGMRLQLVHELLNRCEQGVSVGTEERVRLLTRELWSRRPEACGVTHTATLRARQLADRRGWHPLAVWDDDTIALADAVPEYGVEVSRVQAVVEDTAELMAEGLSRAGIASRLRIQWDAVRQAHRRAGVATPEPRWWEE
ncbi:hypothetical protein [Kitasatospora sp. A2-31]|uniref:hypothetical protein n=1 Tax=Kitasatospora sp. A2-31 TaxID=2916414 RepID=UPI001EE95703|nr:hypothetical protein [Kitasatospora sp. A2-31]MCG6493413.1 hypothetical protein [Kitasatospora sp. A2-31]